MGQLMYNLVCLCSCCNDMAMAAYWACHATHVMCLFRLSPSICYAIAGHLLVVLLDTCWMLLLMVLLQHCDGSSCCC
jgi:hypothetical protein